MDAVHPEHVRIGQLVKILGLSAETWRTYAKLGYVRCVRVRGQRIFDLESCRQFLKTGPQAKQKEWHEMTPRERMAAFRARRKTSNV